MKLLHIFLGVLILAVVGGFGFLASTDIKIDRETVTQEIPSGQLGAADK